MTGAAVFLMLGWVIGYTLHQLWMMRRMEREQRARYAALPPMGDFIKAKFACTPKMAKREIAKLKAASTNEVWAAIPNIGVVGQEWDHERSRFFGKCTAAFAHVRDESRDEDSGDAWSVWVIHVDADIDPEMACGPNHSWDGNAPR